VGVTSELDRFSRFAVEHLSDATYWMEEDASIIYVNEAASRLTGYGLDQLRSMKVYELNVDLNAANWPAIWGLLKAEGRRTFEARHRRQDGRLLDVEVSAHFLELEGKEYSCAFVRDIGERKQLEQKLRHAEKMEAIGRLAGGVAHDFNNQLAGILGYAEVLRRSVRGNDEALRFVEELAKIVHVAADLTAQLLAFSRRGKFLVQPVDLHPLLDEVVGILSRSIDKRIRLETTLQADRPWVSGDPSQLQNVIMNLALNARDAMPQGGTLTLGTANVDFDHASRGHVPAELPPGAYVALSVRDTGVGMTREVQDRVFEPFFTTKDTGAGTGLGLASVYGAVRNHKGAIAVESDVGRGSTFTVYLQVARPGASARPDSAEPPSLRLHGRVLVVEDERAPREAWTNMLESLGCAVTAVADGQSALQLFRDEHGSIDVVLLDIMMPGMGGEETFAAMREVDPGVPVLVMSGYSLDGGAQAMIDAGARGFLQKPFTMATLAGKLGDTLKNPR
jgi:PAS domain S-box-containing protein